MNMKDKLFMIWAIVFMAAILIVLGYSLGVRTLPGKAPDEPILVEQGDDLLFVNPYTPVDSIIFGDNVGRLSWENGIMKFEGDTYESARIFFEYLKGHIDCYIDSEMEKEEEYKPHEYFNLDWGTFDMPCTEVLIIEQEPLQILMEFTSEGEFAKTFRPQLFLKITNTDLSRCFIDGRLRVDLDGEIYWIRLER